MDSIEPIMKLVGGFGATAGPLGLVLWLWWQERAERRELSALLLTLTKSQIEAEQEMTAALNILAAKVAK